MTTSRTDPASRKTAVIIPYYQEESGILRQAVLSAIAQEGVGELEIIVVDDGSPAPARDDLQGLDLPAHVTLKLIEQPNCGPGAARNRALDSLGADTSYVAFLDSDDAWTQGHLSNALCVLEAGYDCYFADLWLSDYKESALARGDLRVEEHACLHPDRKLYTYLGNAKLDLLAARNCIHIPTVVYRFAKVPQRRFPEAFFAGEDRAFLLQLVGEVGNVVFSTNVECVSGHGIHICYGSGWGSQRAVWRLCHDMLWRKWMQRTVPMNKAEAKENSRQIGNLRKAFVAAVLHEVRRRRGSINFDIIRFVLNDPLVLLYVLPLTLNIMFRKVRVRAQDARRFGRSGGWMMR